MSFSKKQPKYIKVGINPVIIVGEKMGKQRIGQDKYALEGNRTGDFVHEAIDNQENIILTNIVNYYYPGNFNPNLNHMDECLKELDELIILMQPSIIIALGGIAKHYLIKLGYRKRIIEFPHPSWINRFMSSKRNKYIELLNKTIHEFNK